MIIIDLSIIVFLTKENYENITSFDVDFEINKTEFATSLIIKPHILNLLMAAI